MGGYILPAAMVLEQHLLENAARLEKEAPLEPKGSQKGSKVRRIWGEWAHGALWGLFRSHFEWKPHFARKVISIGRPFRMEAHLE